MFSDGRNNSSSRTPRGQSKSEMFSNAEDIDINGGQVHNARDMVVININAPGSNHSMGTWFTEIREPTQRSRCNCGTSCPCREIHRQQSNSTTPRTRTRRNRSPEGHGTRSRRWNYREQTNATYSPPDLGGRSRSPERFSSSSRSRRHGPIQESRNSGERVDDPVRRNSNRIGEGRTNGEYSASRRYRGRRFYRRGFNRAVNSYHRAFADDNSLPRSSGSDYVSEGVDSEDYPDSSTQYTQRRRDGPNNGDRRSRMDRAQRY